MLLVAQNIVLIKGDLLNSFPGCEQPAKYRFVADADGLLPEVAGFHKVLEEVAAGLEVRAVGQRVEGDLGKALEEGDESAKVILASHSEVVFGGVAVEAFLQRGAQFGEFSNDGQGFVERGAGGVMAANGAEHFFVENLLSPVV